MILTLLPLGPGAPPAPTAPAGPRGPGKPGAPAIPGEPCSQHVSGDNGPLKWMHTGAPPPGGAVITAGLQLEEHIQLSSEHKEPNHLFFFLLFLSFDLVRGAL